MLASADVYTALAVFTEAVAHVAEQSDSEQTVLSYAGLVAPEDAERAMLHLDDEIAGLLEAADMPAGQDRTHTTKPEPASPVAGQLHTECLLMRCNMACAVLCL